MRSRASAIISRVSSDRWRNVSDVSCSRCSGSSAEHGDHAGISVRSGRSVRHGARSVQLMSERSPHLRPVDGPGENRW
jgi:hypothetical protein